LAATTRHCAAVTKDAVKAWSDAMGEAFLDPFGVGAHAGTITTLGTQGRVAARVAQQTPANIPILTAGTQSRCDAVLDKHYPQGLMGQLRMRLRLGNALLGKRDGMRGLQGSMV
jgi:hypothetical protein